MSGNDPYESEEQAGARGLQRLAELQQFDPRIPIDGAAATREMARMYRDMERERDELRAENERLRSELKQKDRVINALKSMLAESDPCIHVRMQQAVESLERGEGITLEELETRLAERVRSSEQSLNMSDKFRRRFNVYPISSSGAANEPGLTEMVLAFRPKDGRPFQPEELAALIPVVPQRYPDFPPHFWRGAVGLFEAWLRPWRQIYSNARWWRDPVPLGEP